VSGKVDLTGQEIQISQYIACKNYDEKITTIHMCKVYDDIFSKETESNKQQVRKIKRIKRILLVDDEYHINFVLKVLREKWL
jgi:hypothetical protein